MGIFSEEFEFHSTLRFISRFGLKFALSWFNQQKRQWRKFILFGPVKEGLQLDLQYLQRISVYDKSVRGGNWFEFISQKIYAVLDSQCLCV